MLKWHSRRSWPPCRQKRRHPPYSGGIKENGIFFTNACDTHKFLFYPPSAGHNADSVNRCGVPSGGCPTLAAPKAAPRREDRGIIGDRRTIIFIYHSIRYDFDSSLIEGRRPMSTGRRLHRIHTMNDFLCYHTKHSVFIDSFFIILLISISNPGILNHSHHKKTAGMGRFF
jgi:hypothetical protein